MRRQSLVALLAVVISGVIAIVAVAASHDGQAGLDLGIPADSPLVVMHAGDKTCEGPIPLDHNVNVVEFTPAPGGLRGPKMRLTMLDFDSRQILATSSIPREILSGGPRPTVIPPSGGGHAVDICVEHQGGPRVQIWGDAAGGNARNGAEGFELGGLRDPGAIAHPTLNSASARLNGEGISGDVFIRFPARPRTILAEAPAIVERLSRFRMPFFGPWTVWLLLLGVGVGGPLALSLALRRASFDDA